MPSDPGLTVSQILATVDETMLAADYKVGETGESEYWRPASRRVYEDEYGVVGLVVFDSWNELDAGWRRAQAELVHLLSDHLTADEPKAWEGYLLLLTPGRAPTEKSIAEIRYDLTRLRKIAAGGERLRTVGDVKRVVSPVLPLTFGAERDEAIGLLEKLPELIADEEVPEASVQALVQAYAGQESMMQALHRSLGGLRT
jgi:hypothetical protein